ncbi:putative pentatricopeptide repeat-containing protein At1g10330 [Telopea speciosissima]|uniref:putative pentatricopeptide repeat-containing protein At1g10330 n=1 Tax=Telopea speciosissima TaxID=54955 RepID=UPI001CC5F8B5|nr:putative pentatricopeptide repeat-containing protein At1g10330 [Telopea speciosissima]
MSYPPGCLLLLLQRFIECQKHVKQIHALIITHGHLHFNPSWQNSDLKWISTLLYNTLIRAHLNLGDPRKAIILYTHMLAHQAPPNDHTFPSLIKAVSSLPSLASVTGRPIHTQVIRRGLSLDPFIQTSFVSFYAQLGDLSNARHVFEEITRPCIVAFNSMLDALGKNGDMGSALELFQSMPQRDIVSWTSIINGFGKNGYYRKSIWYFEKMMVHEDVMEGLVKPNESTFVSVLSSCASSDQGGALSQGKQIHGYIIRSETEVTVFLGTALVSMYGKTGCLASALRVFNGMVMKGVCTWNAMISSLASNGREKEALNMFDKMRQEGLQPNKVTFVTVLTACARAQLVDLGLEFFQSMQHEYRVHPRMEHYGCVVDLLGRAGRLEAAADFIRGMPFEADATVLGALLGACKVHGAVALATEVGRRLIELQPRHCGRYVVLSNIYAGAGRWGHASALRKAMIEGGIRKIPAYSWLDS